MTPLSNVRAAHYVQSVIYMAFGANLAWLLQNHLYTVLAFFAVFIVYALWSDAKAAVRNLVAERRLASTLAISAMSKGLKPEQLDAQFTQEKF